MQAVLALPAERQRLLSWACEGPVTVRVVEIALLGDLWAAFIILQSKYHDLPPRHEARFVRSLPTDGDAIRFLERFELRLRDLS